MGYSIYIGEGVIDVPSKYDVDWLRVYVKSPLRKPRGPSYPGSGGSCAMWEGGYGHFTKFAEDVGLSQFFFAEESGVLSVHPGALRLRKHHHLLVSAAVQAFKAKHPDVAPSYVEGGVHEKLAMLLEFEYWIGVALETCKLPTMYNR